MSNSSASKPHKLKKIALEEHFMLPEFVEYFTPNKQTVSHDLYYSALKALGDFGDRRIELMDKNGIDYVVLSLSGPGVQIEFHTDVAIRLARKANDDLAAQIHKRPDRYGGFAHLPMQAPEVAADELERCMRQLNFQGALINGHTNGIYLDDPQYDVFWERACALEAPIYLHPVCPLDRPAMYDGHPEMWGPTNSWAAETSAHALRLVFSGVFDRFPGLQIILGHMGETLPIQMWRLDSRYAVANRRFEIRKTPSDYIRSNIKITTAGVCADAALRCSIDAVGLESVMFSIDHPFESTEIASKWMDSAKLTDDEREKVAHSNAERILKLL
ncbi:amidohydrolase family protein (plasmid) [Paraburkholderia sp. D15]|uniref:amidohydrolase family protein n=1 Tax=Paraburkholderia sp. D15 TaxID=2880218 RepID=UPI002478F4B1|nr:amidohydrolase family protein [Paraburkholderia sp. D15]WGS55157.1 amidohydrolase family protein [Paraburkholderia sp. D15]